MASSLEDDLSCPVCCDLYRDPLLLSCGHTFCRQCLKKHWTVNSSRACSVCRRVSVQEPVTNLALRNTAESYQKEKERERKERESGSEGRCLQHGEKVQYLCKSDDEVICSKCKKEKHRTHRVQLLTHAVRQHKDRIKTAIRPTEKALQSLKSGSCKKAQVAKHIQAQAEQAERQIKAEFNKFHHFLKKEEEARMKALKMDVERKKGKVEEMIEREISLLSDRVKEVEEEMENEDATFIKNYEFILKRAQHKIMDSDLHSGNLINMAEHVGNLGYRVWEKMTDIFLYHPVLLDLNRAPEDFSISDDLASVKRSGDMQLNRIPLNGNRLVLGSEGYGEGFHFWNVEVGDNKHWTLGICRRSGDTNLVKQLTPEMGFWGLSRKGESYTLLPSFKYSFRIQKKPQTVQVQLGRWCTLGNPTMSRMVRFVDVSDGAVIACYTGLPNDVLLFPFLIPEDRFSYLRIAPVSPALIIQHTVVETQQHQIHVYLMYVLIFFYLIWMLVFRVNKVRD